MAKITISYPTSWLVVSISVKDRLTWVEVFSWLMTESSGAYNYDFTEVANTDYTYIASTTWYDNVTWVLFQDTSTWGWATVADIWQAQIGDYSDTVGSFANKFSTYGGVSHIIDRSSLDDTSKAQLTWFKDKMEEFSNTLKEFKSNEKDFNNIVDAIKNQPNKTTIVNNGWKYEETIWELLVESIPQLIDKLDEATQIIPLYEELITYMEQRENDWEKLVQDIIDNN